MIAILLITFIIPQVKAITSDNVLYGEGNVTEALDELNKELNICITSGDATADSILSGKTAYVQGKLVTGTIASKAAATYTPTTSNQTIAAGQYLSGAQTIAGDANLIAGNIKNGTKIFNVTGTYTSDGTVTNGNQMLSGYIAYSKGTKYTGTIASKGTATYTPGTSNQTIAAGQYLSGAQTIKGDANLKASNIACGVTIFGVKGTKGCAGDTTSTTKTGLAATAKVGEYVQMTPSVTSYTIPKALTGHSSTVTIKPSELKLWRIIRINNDGTIEMVSEYVSSTAVTFKGETGYKNFVGALNILASLYANYEYTLTTRHMGYNGQTEFLTATLSQTTCGTSFTANNSKETSGCGDISYQADTDLVKAAVGSLAAYKVNATSTEAQYWIGSRYYDYIGSSNFHFEGRQVWFGNSTFSVQSVSLYGWNYTGEYAYSPSYGLRPIVVLKSGVSASSGSGTKAKPWVLS